MINMGWLKKRNLKEDGKITQVQKERTYDERFVITPPVHQVQEPVDETVEDFEMLYSTLGDDLPTIIQAKITGLEKKAEGIGKTVENTVYFSDWTKFKKYLELFEQKQSEASQGNDFLVHRINELETTLVEFRTRIAELEKAYSYVKSVVDQHSSYFNIGVEPEKKN